MAAIWRWVRPRHWREVREARRAEAEALERHRAKLNETYVAAAEAFTGAGKVWVDAAEVLANARISETDDAKPRIEAAVDLAAVSRAYAHDGFRLAQDNREDRRVRDAASEIADSTRRLARATVALAVATVILAAATVVLVWVTAAP